VLEPGRVSVFQSLTGSNTNTGTHLSTTFTTNSLSPSLPVSAISPRDVSKGQWQLVDQYETIKMPVIPLVPFYTNKIRFMESSPPMLALAWLNVEHWQSSSEQNTILHYARVPQKFYKGFREEDVNNEHSSALAIWNPDPESDVKWIEIASGGEGAIPQGRVHLLDIEGRSASLGTDLLVRRNAPSAGNATDASIAAAESMSELGTWALGYGDALKQAYALMALYGGLTTDPEKALGLAGTPRVFSDFGVNLDERPELEMLLKLGIANYITPQTLLSECKKRGIIDESVDIAEEVTEMAPVRERVLAVAETRGSKPGLSNNEGAATKGINDNPKGLSKSDG